MGVSEYQTVSNPLYYVLFLGCLWLYFKVKNKLLFSLLGVSFLSSLIFGRLALFSSVIMIFALFLYIDKFKEKQVVALFLLLFSVSYVVLIDFDEKPKMNKVFEETILSVPEGTQIYSFWDNGHFIEYYDRKSVYHSNPSHFETFIPQYYSNECLFKGYFLVSSQDYYKLKWLNPNIEPQLIKDLLNGILPKNSILVHYNAFEGKYYWMLNCLTYKY
jgi:hypothetical protein